MYQQCGRWAGNALAMVLCPQPRVFSRLGQEPRREYVGGTVHLRVYTFPGVFREGF